LDQIAHVVNPNRKLTLISREINYFRNISTYVITVPERHRQTERQTDDILCGFAALCVASRGKN